MDQCFTCKAAGKETRATYDSTFGMIFMCEDCTRKESVGMSGWDPDICDDCACQTAFGGPINGYPDGVRCDTCKRPNEAPWWVCVHCFVKNHEGHKFECFGGISELDIILRRITGEI